jgi:cytochrome c oxidase assembly factor CtaG/cytochrome c2
MQRMSHPCWLHAVPVLCCVAIAPPVAAHGVEVGQLGWNWEAWVLASLALAVFGYVRGLLRMDAGARDRVFGIWRCAAFAAGIGVLVLALLSPLDALDDQLFSAHMLQHMLLILVAPPLFVWSRPATAWLWAFELPARRVIGRFWMGAPGVQCSIRFLMRPLAVWVLSSFALWFWHLPGPYGWALGNEWVHTGEHLSFFLTALAFWSLVLAPYGRRQLSYGASLLFVGTLGMQMGLIGAILTFATRPLYLVHGHSTMVWGLTSLEDQQLAGLIMWVPAGLVYTAAMSGLFVAWLRDAGHRAVSATKQQLTRDRLLRSASAASLLLVALASSGCQDNAAASPWKISGAQPARGPALIRHYGCGACHTVPGVAQADGTVGPPLTQFGRRAYIAGTLQNNPDNLILWLRDPQQVAPGNAMPNTGLTQRDARDIAAYLYTLQ